MFDINTLAPAAVAFMHLKSPSDEEPIFIGQDDKRAVGITFHSPGSPAYEAAITRRTNRSLVRSKKKAELTADLLRADQVDFLVDCTVSFDNLGYSPAGDAKGEALFKALYSDRKFGWATEQATAFLGDWGNFTPTSATS